jgi:hypothetical protein
MGILGRIYACAVPVLRGAPLPVPLPPLFHPIYYPLGWSTSVIPLWSKRMNVRVLLRSGTELGKLTETQLEPFQGRPQSFGTPWLVFTCESPDSADSRLSHNVPDHNNSAPPLPAGSMSPPLTMNGASSKGVAPAAGRYGYVSICAVSPPIPGLWTDRHPW